LFRLGDLDFNLFRLFGARLVAEFGVAVNRAFINLCLHWYDKQAK
jgi:hypothetical protein